jgi:hypothetical protein
MRLESARALKEQFRELVQQEALQSLARLPALPRSNTGALGRLKMPALVRYALGVAPASRGEFKIAIRILGEATTASHGFVQRAERLARGEVDVRSGLTGSTASWRI